MSEKSTFQDGKPIRGGVPVCYPWFGPKSDDPTAPMHGFARLQEWTVTSISDLPGGEVGVILELLPSDLSRKFWPHNFHVEHRIRVGRELSMSLVTRNTGTEPFTVNEALHSYFHVGDCRQLTVTGLENVEYTDKTRGMKRFTESKEPITITTETDRHYLNTATTVTIHDQSLKRRILVAKAGSKSTVVWNPWVAKAAAMPDFGDDEWKGMLCVETANAADNAVSVAPNSDHEMQAIISVRKL
jgi:D-hexose-6-phosphate mutarotase